MKVAAIHGMVWLATSSAAQPVALPAAPAGVQVTRSYGIEFATVSSVNNPGIPYDTLLPGPFQSPVQLQGRGSVGYEYRIARTETTTLQWMSFINTFAGRSDYPEQIRNVVGFELQAGPHFWGAAAMYANWLHNDQSSQWSSLLDGAYDVSTFGRSSTVPFSFTDAATHRPGARFWIPGVDEWLKATFFDPNRAGAEQAGWWQYVNRSDIPPTVGIPGEGTTSARLYDDVNDAPAYWSLPLVSYPDQQSAFGLFDTSGGAAELAEDYFQPEVYDPPVYDPRYRLGAWMAAQGMDTEFRQHVFGDVLSRLSGSIGTAGTAGGGDLVTGLRIAAAIPAPSTFAIGCCFWSLVAKRRRRELARTHQSA